MKVLIVLCVFITTIFAFVTNIPRLINGESAGTDQFKYIASLRYEDDDEHFCGAAIISPRTLLTAAHCEPDEPDEVVAVLGTRQLDNDDCAVRYEVAQFNPHEQFTDDTFLNDIAVVILSECIVFDNPNIAIIPLAQSKPCDKENVLSSEWDYALQRGEDDLHLRQTEIISLERCAANETVRSTLIGKICTVGGLRESNLGGPLINERDELIGITSTGHRCGTAKPDYSTDVVYYKKWIEDHKV